MHVWLSGIYRHGFLCAFSCSFPVLEQAHRVAVLTFSLLSRRSHFCPYRSPCSSGYYFTSSALFTPPRQRLCLSIVRGRFHLVCPRDVLFLPSQTYGIGSRYKTQAISPSTLPAVASHFRFSNDSVIAPCRNRPALRPPRRREIDLTPAHSRPSATVNPQWHQSGFVETGQYRFPTSLFVSLLMGPKRDTVPVFAPPRSASSPRKPRPLSSRSSSSDTSASSPKAHDHQPRPPSSSGIGGRKVAESLQLFKESDAGFREPRQDSLSLEPRSHRSSSKVEDRDVVDLSQPQFEFVERSAWPDREKSAIKRQRSLIFDPFKALECTPVDLDSNPTRGKEKKSSIRDSVLNEVNQWRKDVSDRHDAGRGRRRERSDTSPACPVPDPLDGSLPSSSHFHPRHGTYPPSPSPSRSPIARSASLSTLSASTETHPTSLDRPSAHLPPSVTPPASKSHSELATFRHPPSVDDTSESCTDEDWDTASATTASSADPLHTPHESPLFGDDDSIRRSLLALAPSHGEFSKSQRKNESSVNLDIDVPQEELPHIPLRPFRNQVGGHSAIYRFTTRAVCKVRKARSFSYVPPRLT